jgi:transcriptional regulator with XRE-family HTH domain
MSIPRYGKDIASFVRRLREDLEISQSEMGKLLGVHGQYVSNVERGVNKNPIAFCSLLFSICPRDRKEYLLDLTSEAGSDRALARVRRAQGGGKWHDRSKGKRLLRNARA